MDHFSHEHPLMLIDEVPKRGDGEEKIVCYGCQKPILGSAYSCSENCNYFLHNKCAQLPKEIKHPMHSQHPLTLLAKPPSYYSSSCICNLCKIGGWKWFTYHCSLCHFDIHIQCILEDKGVTKHECHDHPLTLVQRSALFCCDACGVEDKDSSYRCTICPFWIHNTCASLPNTINHSDHHHPLVLAFSIPNQFRTFTYLCYTCHKMMHRSHWVYHCADCRYFVHLKCATAKKEPLMLRGEIEAEDPKMMHFPMPNGSVNLMTKIVQEVNSEDNEIGTELLHFSHEHPLHLSKAPKDDEIICNGCVRPISTPFYHCEQCDFCLHRSCAQLPRFQQMGLTSMVDTNETDLRYKIKKCSCGEFADVKITHSNKNGNRGRLYYSCPKGSCDEFGGWCNPINLEQSATSTSTDTTLLKHLLDIKHQITLLKIMIVVIVSLLLYLKI